MVGEGPVHRFVNEEAGRAKAKLAGVPELGRQAEVNHSGNVKGIVARSFNEQAILQRPYVRRLNETQLTELEGKGMVFSKPEISSFQQMLRKSGFYVEWKKKFGPEAWALLEKYAGQLA